MNKVQRSVFMSVTVAVLLGAAGRLDAASFLVKMTNFTFKPSVLTITVGDSVTWTNTAGNHTTTSGDTNTCSPSSLWHSGNVAAASPFTVNFSTFAPGTYTYMCTNHCGTPRFMIGRIIVNAAANTPPTVSITNPITGAKFVGPTNLTIGATAADPGGSVTNVQFLVGATSIGNATTSPYAATTNGLPAGNYALSAIASDNNGAKTTSSVVNIFVLTSATLTAPLLSADGQFQFTVLGINGQTYATETSTNLTNWTAILTNLAPADIFSITDSTSSNLLQRYYRTRQDLF